MWLALYGRWLFVAVTFHSGIHSDVLAPRQTTKSLQVGSMDKRIGCSLAHVPAHVRVYVLTTRCIVR